MRKLLVLVVLASVLGLAFSEAFNINGLDDKLKQILLAMNQQSMGYSGFIGSQNIGSTEVHSSSTQYSQNSNRYSKLFSQFVPVSYGSVSHHSKLSFDVSYWGSRGYSTSSSMPTEDCECVDPSSGSYSYASYSHSNVLSSTSSSYGSSHYSSATHSHYSSSATHSHGSFPLSTSGVKSTSTHYSAISAKSDNFYSGAASTDVLNLLDKNIFDFLNSPAETTNQNIRKTGFTEQSRCEPPQVWVCKTKNPTLSPTLTPTESTTTSAPTLTPTLSPTLAPVVSTLAPTAEAKTTSAPTLAPVVSTNAPTLKPSATPTLNPTAAPSTKSGVPVASPTYAPTMPLGPWLTKLDAIVSNLTDSTSNTVDLYSEFYMGSTAVSGSCYDWGVYGSNTLFEGALFGVPLSLEYYVYTSLTQTSPTVAVCSDASAVSTLVNAMTVSSTTTVSATCGGYTWQVKACSTGQAPAVCAGCSDPCKSTCSSSNPFLTAPCSSLSTGNCGYENGIIRVLSATFTPPKTAPTISNQDISSTQTTLTYQGELSDVGLMYCGVFTYGDVPSSVDEIISQNIIGTVVLDNGTYIGTAVALNLNPSSTYDMYCVTETDFGDVMTLDNALSTLLTGATSCCRDVSVTIGVGSVYQSTNSVDAIVVALSSPVTSGNMTVTLTGTLPDNSVVSLFPSSYMFSSSIKSSKTTFSIPSSVTSKVGTVTITATLTGSAASSYGAVFTDSKSTFTVVSSSTPPATPVFMRAQFSNDGSTVIASFDSRTDRGATKITTSTFACSLLFSFTNVAGASCVWSTDSAVSIRLGSEASVLVGSTITYIGGVVTAYCPSIQCSSFASSKSVSLLGPSSVLVPTVSISAPPVIGICDKLSLDLSSSLGSGGRAWSSIVFSVTGSNSTISSAITKYLNSITGGFVISPPSAIPSYLFDSKVGYYSFTVTLSNFLGGSNSGTTTVVVTSSVVPIISILGSQMVTMKRSAPLTITSDAYVTLCGSSATATKSGISYAWNSYVTVDGSMVSTSLHSNSKQTNLFKLNSYTLDTNKVYTFNVVASYSGSPMTSTATIQVYVAPSNLVAVISGGESQGIKPLSSLTIVGSKSYDQDQTGVYGTSAGLSYSWACVQTAPALSSSCPLALPNSLTTENIIVTSTSDSVNTTSQITLTVYDSTRASTASIYVVALSAGAPIVSFTTSATSKVNVDSKLVLGATIDYKYSGSASWSVDSSTLSLSQIALTSVTQSLKMPTSSAGSLSNINFVLKPNTLPERATLTFTLTASLDSGEVTASSITIVTNGPPLPGLFVVSPLSGTELKTPFLLSARQWDDSDLPLTYSFGFLSTTGTFQVVQAQSQLAYGASVLPAGSDTSNYTVTCVLSVFDALTSASTADVDVHVARSDNATETQILIMEQLVSSLEDVNGLKQALSTSTASLNFVSCLGAPNCAALNRNNCSTVADTCGACEDGYYGDANSNDPCVAEVDRRKLGSVGSKSCDCENNGVCNFYSTTSNLQVSTCSIGNPTCFPACTCPLGYYGATCSLTTEDALQAQTTRDQLIAAFGLLLLTEDADALSVSSWANNLAALTQVADDISVNTTSTVNSLVFQVLQAANETGISYDSVDCLLDVVDTTYGIVSTSLLSNSSSSDPMYVVLPETDSIMQLFSGLLLSNVVAGQDSVSYIYDNFRIQVESVTPSNAVASLSTPLSTAEVSYGVSAQQVNVSVDSDVSNVIGSLISIRSLSADVDEALGLDSATLVLQLSDSSVCSGSSSCSFTTGLVTNSDMDYVTSSSAMSYVTACHSEPTTHVYSCPNGDITVTCSGTPSNITTSCPYYNQEPACVRIADDFVTSNDMCTTSSYGSEYTTCSCEVSQSLMESAPTSLWTDITSSNSRRLSSVDGSVSSVQVASSVVNTLITPTAVIVLPESYMDFESTFVLVGVSSATLDTASKQAIVNATARSMGIPYGTVMFQSSASVQSVAVSFHRVSSNSVKVVTKTTLTSLDFPSYTYSMTSLYNSVSAKLSAAVSGTSFITYLNAASSYYGATATAAVSSASVTNSNPLVFGVAPTYAPTTSPDSSSSTTNLRKGGYIALWVFVAVIGVLLILGAVMFYRNRAQLWVRLFGPTSTTSPTDFTPIPGQPEQAAAGPSLLVESASTPNPAASASSPIPQRSIDTYATPAVQTPFAGPKTAPVVPTPSTAAAPAPQPAQNRNNFASTMGFAAVPAPSQPRDNENALTVTNTLQL